ncbi:CH25H [Mytilus coruscus]|uniref:CH25H n=1 Tax=Mytilus coruscus TaxID=42192 RepID=A0A6J8E309_MYTCO|nr:CH25H [Mytilus coruscus]
MTYRSIAFHNPDLITVHTDKAIMSTTSIKVSPVPKQQKSKNCQQKQALYDETYDLVLMTRILIVGVLVLMYIYSSQVQTWIDQLWYFLLTSTIYNSVYFETWFTTFCYAFIIAIYPFVLHYIKPLEKYKIHPSVTYEHQSVLFLVWKAILYMAPLATMDTFIVKKYHGVQPDVWDDKRVNWIQTTRALPEMPPTVLQLIVHLIGSVLLFDLIFFFIHFSLHKNFWLYKTFHRYHHDHDVLHPHITDQLTVTERLALVLSANFALKCFNSHPLTRTFFVPVFVFLLVENHTGYDIPLGIHRIIPFGILSGPVKHYNHHVNGERNYQPFLNYMDYIFIK